MQVPYVTLRWSQPLPSQEPCQSLSSNRQTDRQRLFYLVCMGGNIVDREVVRSLACATGDLIYLVTAAARLLPNTQNKNRLSVPAQP